MNELIIKIGPLFWVLSVLAVYALAVVAERILYFHRIQINTGDFLRGISKLVNAGKTDEARHEASILPGPAARVVSSVLAHAGLRREELRTVAEDSVQMEVFQIEKNIRRRLPRRIRAGPAPTAFPSIRPSCLFPAPREWTGASAPPLRNHAHTLPVPGRRPAGHA